jgi:uncharacterized protein (TIGR02231 family)
MIRNALPVLSLATLLLTPSWLAMAAADAPIGATSHVVEATVFSDRALITRLAHIHVPAGAHVISISNMPAGMNEATLRVQGKAAVPVKIGAVDIKHVFLTEAANAAERDKQAQIDAKINDKALVQGDMNALKAREDFITHIVQAGALTHDAQGNAKLDFAPEKWQQAWTAVQTGMAETQKDMAAKTVAMKKIDEDIARMQEELAQVRSQQSAERRDAQINVEASADTDLDLTLSYQTSGASWQPVYDARLDTSGGQLDLEQYGAVRQLTGEDWDEVALTLSTAQPVVGSEMPRIGEWLVRLFQPAIYPGRMNGASLAMSSAKMAMQSEDGYAPEVASAPPPVMAQQEQALAVTTEYSAEFKVPGKVDVKSAADSTRLHIADVHMKAALSARATPGLAPQAYLFASATNHESYPLIPGTVAKFRDGSFIGNASLPLVRPNEEAKFSFGVDDRIKVDYKRVKESQDNPALLLIGDMTVEREYEAKVDNLHKEPVALTIISQFPVSADPDVKVDRLDDQTTPGSVPDPDKMQGVIEWNDTLKAGESKTYDTGWRVSYPKGKTLQGL